MSMNNSGGTLTAAGSVIRDKSVGRGGGGIGDDGSVAVPDRAR
jgi:hypothetical protein